MSRRTSIPVVYPTGMFAALLFVLAAMWYAGASQNNAAIYLTLSVVLVSIPHTLLNLGGLSVRTESVKPVFAGQEVSVPIEVVNEARSARRACVVHLPDRRGARETIDAIPAGRAARVTLRFPAQQRGEFQIRAVRLRTIYPLGFFAARRRFATEQQYLVYPRPDGDSALPSGRANAGERPQNSAGDGGDYAGVRAYVPGESQRQVDWKAVARGQPMMTKQFTAETDDATVHLDFAAITLADIERRLSQLALWVIEAERARRRYSLHLPGGQEFRAGSGDAHYHDCLRALALYR